jgi:pimeloyl-ACP methyl ester carboxylesterase
MTLDLIWFGQPHRPLAGYLHMPPGRITGGVLICPPFGYEAICAHRTLRCTAERLADAGYLVLRFDYAGTGGSSGTGFEPDLLERWQDSVLAGVDELRRWGVERPSLVGMRLGAALACAVAGRGARLGPIVLWAPVTSGRRYWRELRAQAAISPGGATGDGSLNVMGHPVPPDVVRALKSWNPLGNVDPDTSMLVVQSPGWRDADDAAADFAAAGLRPGSIEAPGTSEVLERSAEEAKAPMALIRSLCDWIDAASSRSGKLVAPECRASVDDTRVIKTETGLVEEQIVTVASRRLPGVITRPIGASARSGVIFLNNGVAPAVGPGRAWVEFARELGVDGVASLRFDFSGIGNGPNTSRRLTGRDRMYTRARAAELLAAVDRLRADGVQDITVVGLCSGAHVAVRTAAYRGRVENIFAINLAVHYLPNIGVGPWIHRLWGLTALPMSKRPVAEMLRRVPERLWMFLDRVRIFPSPACFLRRAWARKTYVRLVFAEGDRGLHDVRCRSSRAIALMVADGQMGLDVITRLDHSMFERTQRSAVMAALRQTCDRSAQPLDRYASS